MKAFAITNIHSESYNQIKTTYQNNIEKLHVTEIDGGKIKSWNDYSLAISEAFQFPKFPNVDVETIDGYLDWMTDLSWLETTGYVLFIKNYSKLLINFASDVETVESVLGTFCTRIFPYWKDGGLNADNTRTSKSFQVFLVD